MLLVEDELLIDATGNAAVEESAPAPPAQPKNAETMHVDFEGRPNFAPAQGESESHRAETRKVLIPPHRVTPLRKSWSKIYPPLVEHLKLQVRMNERKKQVELRTSKHTLDTVSDPALREAWTESDQGALTKAADFVQAFSLVSLSASGLPAEGLYLIRSRASMLTMLSPCFG